MMKLRENVTNSSNAIIVIRHSSGRPSSPSHETQSSHSTHHSNKKMKHFHTIDAENDENTNGGNTGSGDDDDSDGPTQLSATVAPSNKATVPRIRIRLGKKHQSLSSQQQPSSIGGGNNTNNNSNNAFGLKVESLDSFSFEEEDDDEDDDETIQLLEDDDDSSSSDSGVEARDPAASVVSPSSSTSSLQQRQRQRRNAAKRVSFGMVQIQEYTLTLGDHPFADSYPISLDWPHTEAREYNLDIFEKVRRISSAKSPLSLSPSTSKVPCRHLSPAQRRSRLANISGIHPSDLAKQEQLRHQQLVVEMEQRYYSNNNNDNDEMEVDGPYEAHEECDPHFVREPPTPSPHAASSAAASAAAASCSDRTSVMTFWDEFETDAFEPLELSRTKSVADLDPVDCSILQYLCEGDRNGGGGDSADAEFSTSKDNHDTFRTRRLQHRHSDVECSAFLNEERRRKSSPW
jgi:hypothetical protein